MCLNGPQPGQSNNGKAATLNLYGLQAIILLWYHKGKGDQRMSTRQGGAARFFMRLAAATGIVAWTLLCSVVQAKQSVLIVGDDDYPPYSYLENGRNQGIYHRILERVFAAMPEYDVEVRLYPWKRALRMVEQGRALGIVPPYLGYEERPYLAPYSDPILEEVTVAWCRDDVGMEPGAAFPRDYDGITFGLNTGFHVVARPFQRAVQQGRVSVDPVPGTQRNIERMLLGRVDCYINDRRSIIWTLHEIATQEGSARIKDVHEISEVARYAGHIGFSARRAEARDFVARFNTELRRLRETGEIDAIVEAYMREATETMNHLAR